MRTIEWLKVDDSINNKNIQRILFHSKSPNIRTSSKTFVTYFCLCFPVPCSYLLDCSLSLCKQVLWSDETNRTVRPEWCEVYLGGEREANRPRNTISTVKHCGGSIRWWVVFRHQELWERKIIIRYSRKTWRKVHGSLYLNGDGGFYMTTIISTRLKRWLNSRIRQIFWNGCCSQQTLKTCGESWKFALMQDIQRISTSWKWSGRVEPNFIWYLFEPRITRLSG